MFGRCVTTLCFDTMGAFHDSDKQFPPRLSNDISLHRSSYEFLMQKLELGLVRIKAIFDGRYM